MKESKKLENNKWNKIRNKQTNKGRKAHGN
jgi:hypothetical protein